MTKDTLDKKEAIKSIVHASVESFAVGFQGRHEGELEDPEGTLNMKIHNVFITVLGPEIQYYTALVRSLDSSLGNMLEKMAINIAKLTYEVKQNVEGPLSLKQTQDMAELLEKYKRREIPPPTAGDYQFLRVKPEDQSLVTKRHDSDYYLIDKETGDNFLIKSAFSLYASSTTLYPSSDLHTKSQKSFPIKSSSSEKYCLTLSCFHSFPSPNRLYAVAKNI